MADYLEPYRKAVDELGAGFESLLWRSREFQQTRFKVLLESAASGLSRPDTIATLLRLEGRVIADMGCGRADLLAWMNQVGLRYGRYIGVEAIPELAGASREIITEHAYEEADIVESDFVEDSDVFESLARSRGVELFVFSGSLNTFEQPDAEAVIARAFRAIEGKPSSGVVFNFLSDLSRQRAHQDTGPARRFDTIGLSRFASTLTRRFNVRHDYLQGHDATIGLFTPPAGVAAE